MRQLYQRWLRWRARPEGCPKCGATAGEEIARRTADVHFHEQIGGGEAGGTVRPLITHEVTYACTACRHHWTRLRREF